MMETIVAITFKFEDGKPVLISSLLLSKTAVVLM